MAIEEPLGFGIRMSLLALGGNDGRFHVWQAATGDRVMSVPHGERDATHESMRRAPLVDAEISLDGGALSVSSSGSVAFWRGRADPDSALIWMSQSPSGRVRDVDISPDNRVVAVAGERAIYLLNPHPGQQIWTALDASVGEPQRVLFSPGGGLLATVWSDGEIRLYSVASRERVRTMRVGDRWVPALLAFSPDGQQLAATDGFRVIQIWAMRDGSTPVALTAPRSPVQSLWFTADAQNVVVSGRGDRYLRSLPIPVTP
jgi:WD40 repeat protein